MGHNPIPPPPRRTAEWVKEERLRLLREMYVRDEIALPDLERFATMICRGEQPEACGCPVMADPRLYETAE